MVCDLPTVPGCGTDSIYWWEICCPLIVTSNKYFDELGLEWQSTVSFQVIKHFYFRHFKSLQVTSTLC